LAEALPQTPGAADDALLDYTPLVVVKRSLQNLEKVFESP